MPGITVLAMRAMALMQFSSFRASVGATFVLQSVQYFPESFRRQAGGLFFHAYEIVILLIQLDQYPKSFANH